MENDRPLARVAFAGLLFTLFFSACRKDVGPAKWDIDVIAPVITTRFTISDLVPDSLLSIASDGGITLVYTSELFAVDLDTVLAVPDTSFVYPYAFPLPGNDSFDLPAGFPVISEDNLIRFDLEELALRKLILREGRIDLFMRNKIASRIFGTFEFEGAAFSDGSSSLAADVGPGSVSSPTNSTETADLAGSVFDLRGPQFNSVNTLTTAVSARLDPDGNGATVTSQDSIIITVAYQGLVPQYALGYFGSRELPYGPESTPVDLFRSIVGGTLDLDRVRVDLKVENGIGMDLRMRIRELSGLNTRTGSQVGLEHAVMNGPINLERALDLGNTFEPRFYETVLDENNSNIDLFLENLPDRLDLALDLTLNPLGDISNGNDFFYYDSRLSAKLELELPLDLIATGLTLESFIEPDLPGNEEGHAILDGELQLFASNGFPFDAGLILDIIGEDGSVLSPVVVQGNIPSGVLGSNGLVVSSTPSRMRAQLTADQVDLLYGAGRLRARVVFDTADQQQHVRLLDSYGLDLQITANIHYLVNGDE